MPDCPNKCPPGYPFCFACWRRVPKDERAAVRAALKLRGTPDLDRAALYYAVTKAAASVHEVVTLTPEAAAWERVYRAAGSPNMDERVYGLL